MNNESILNKMTSIIQQPYLIFMQRFSEKPNNTLKTLTFLNDEENVTAGMIAEYLDIKPSSVTQIIKKLEEAGTAERIKSDTDARVTFVRITEHGREVSEKSGGVSNELCNAVFKGFTDDELNQLNDYLDRISDNLSSEEFSELLDKFFGDDARWQQFEKMSTQFSRAREEMMEQHDPRNCHQRFNPFDRSFGRRDDGRNNRNQQWKEDYR